MIFEEEADGNSTLLLEMGEDPAAGMRKMSKVLGRCGTALIEHIIRNCNSEPRFADGEAWFCRSIDNLALDIGYCRRSGARTVTALAYCNVLTVGCYNASRMDRTKWYRVDMDVLAEALANGGF